MPIDYTALAPGDAISDETYRLDETTVARYVAAVGDGSAPISGDGRPDLAPPMAVAALSLRGVIVDLQVPAGTLHAGQELEFLRAVHVGETLNCRATLSQNSVRGERRFIVVQVSVEDGQGGAVMRGKSTLVVPAQS